MRLCGPGSGEVHCWIFRTADFVVSDLAAILAPDERARAARFFFEKDRNEYVVCRGILRHLLSAYVNVGASRLKFEYSTRGKPAIARLQDSIQFNLAHSHGAGLIGITSSVPVGVDVERLSSLERVRSLVPTCFAPEEQVAFASLAPSLQQRAFYTGWARKEAFIKAIGEGLARPLHSFAVTIGPDVRPKVLRCDRDPWMAGASTLADVPGGNEFAAAVMVPAANVALASRELQPSTLGLRHSPDSPGYAASFMVAQPVLEMS